MQIRLYLDEDSMSRSLVRELRARGVDVSTTIAEGMLGRNDTTPLEYAKTQRRVIVLTMSEITITSTQNT